MPLQLLVRHLYPQIHRLRYRQSSRLIKQKRYVGILVSQKGSKGDIVLCKINKKCQCDKHWHYLYVL